MTVNSYPLGSKILKCCRDLRDMLNAPVPRPTSPAQDHWENNKHNLVRRRALKIWFIHENGQGNLKDFEYCAVEDQLAICREMGWNPDAEGFIKKYWHDWPNAMPGNPYRMGA